MNEVITLNRATLYIGPVTTAMRGKKLLEKNGIPVWLQRSLNSGETNGCGYVLLINGTAESALSILSKAGIKASVEKSGRRDR